MLTFSSVVTFDFAPQKNLWGHSMTYIGAARGLITENAGMTLEEHHEIYSTPAEDLAMIRQIRQEMKNPPRYNFFFSNCIQWAVEAIDYGR